MKRIRDIVSDALYKEPGYLDLMKILIGLCLIGILPLELFIVFGYGPYHVPAWRIGQHFFVFPEPAIWVSVVVWLLYFCACICMVIGKGGRLVPFLLFAVWLYYQTLDRHIFQSSFVIMMSVYLLAFSIDRRPRSLSRVLIRVAVSTCYIFAGLHKLHPEFFSGLTMYRLLSVGEMIRPELLPLIRSMNLSRFACEMCTYLVVMMELFIGIGLWFKPLRKAAVATGVVLHLSLTFFIPGIELFAPVMWTGYLAFFDKRRDALSVDLSKRVYSRPLAEALLAIIVSIMCVVMPARLFFASPYNYLHMSLYDRVPWGFSMFLFTENIKYVAASVREKGNWVNVALEGRMPNSSSRSDLIAMSYYLAKTHPQADCVRVENRLQINGHGLLNRIYYYFPRVDRVLQREVIVDGMRVRR